jgi:hypothetical protein
MQVLGTSQVLRASAQLTASTWYVCHLQLVAWGHLTTSQLPLTQGVVRNSDMRVHAPFIAGECSLARDLLTPELADRITGCAEPTPVLLLFGLCSAVPAAITTTGKCCFCWAPLACITPGRSTGTRT